MASLKPTVVIGLGNPLMSDEGIGIRVLAQLQNHAERFPDTEFLDLGTSTVSVLHAIANRSKAVFIDCAFMGEPAGAIRAFTPAEVQSGKAQSGLSLHEGDLLATLDLSSRLGEIPPVVRIFGIQPFHVGMGHDLSPALQARLDEYVARVTKDISTI
jgi:hydrogenase maturation protease